MQKTDQKSTSQKYTKEDKESSLLIANKEFMASYQQAKEQIKKRDFCEWDEL